MLVLKKNQREYFRKIVHYKFAKIKRVLNLDDPYFTFKVFEKIFEKYGDEFFEGDDKKRLELFSQFHVAQKCKELREDVNFYWKGIPLEFIDEILDENKDIIEEEIKNLKDIVTYEDSKEHLNDIAAYSFFENMTGVIIAGFGDDEIFPSVYSHSWGNYKEQIKI